MDLIPYSKVNIETNLSSDDVIARIKENTLLVDSFELFLKQPKELFMGQVFENSFKIYRKKIGDKNSFIPIVKGEVSSNENITEIEMKILPPIIGLIVITIAFLVLAVMVLTQELNEFILLIPIFIYGYITYSFHSLRKEYVQKIYEIVEGESMIEL